MAALNRFRPTAGTLLLWFIFLLLLIPILNYLPAAFIGLTQAILLLRGGKLVRLLLFLVMCAGWFALSGYWMRFASGDYLAITPVALAHAVLTGVMLFLVVKWHAETVPPPVVLSGRIES